MIPLALIIEELKEETKNIIVVYHDLLTQWSKDEILADLAAVS